MTDQRHHRGQKNRDTADRASTRRSWDQQQHSCGHLEPARHPMKTGRITPTREGVPDRSRTDEVDRPSPDHHDAEHDRKPDRDEFVYLHGSLLLVLLAAGSAALRRLAKWRHGTDLA